MKTARRVKRPTLKQLAEEAGVSIGTASNILSGKTQLHSPQTVERVLTVARQLGYRPNRVARSLAARRTHTVGVVVEPQHAVFTRNPYVTAVLDGVVDSLTPRGYHLKIITLSDLNPRTLWHQIDDGTVDGVIIVAPLISSPLLDYHAHTQLPCVVVGSTLPEALGFYCIDCDNEAMMSRLTEYLIRMGHRRIGFVKGPDNQWSAQQRLHAYLSVMGAHGIRVEADWIAPSNYEYSGGLAAAEQLLRVRPRLTAIIASNDMVALGVLDACAQHGVRVPADVSVVGFDDVPLAALAKPPLTTIRIPIHDIGVEAAQTLLHQIETGETLQGARLVQGELIVRESAAPPHRAKA
ncbi:MAG: LacI family DNA-binding transcriptional regulator [Armatimonadota bacterium]|nr:LacI family DNA-binding transcriptional regulator [Armatimonadota bacterium]